MMILDKLGLVYRIQAIINHHQVTALDVTAIDVATDRSDHKLVRREHVDNGGWTLIPPTAVPTDDFLGEGIGIAARRSSGLAINARIDPSLNLTIGASYLNRCVPQRGVHGNTGNTKTTVRSDHGLPRLTTNVAHRRHRDGAPQPRSSRKRSL